MLLGLINGLYAIAVYIRLMYYNFVEINFYLKVYDRHADRRSILLLGIVIIVVTSTSMKTPVLDQSIK